MAEYKTKSELVVPPEYREGTMSRRGLLKSALEIAVATYLGKKLLGSSSAYAQQPISAPATQLRYDPGDISILSTPIGRQALEIAVTGGTQIGRPIRTTTLLAPGSYDRLLFAPTPEAQIEIDRHGLSYERDYVPTINNALDAAVAQTNGLIRLNPPTLIPQPLTNLREQLNRNGFNIAVHTSGESFFQGENLNALGLNTSFTIDRSNLNRITGGIVELNARQIPTLAVLKGLTIHEILEGFFLNSDNLKTRSPVDNLPTTLVYLFIGPLSQFFSQPGSVITPMDAAVLRALYAVGEGRSLEEVYQMLGLE